ncbi:hypothetical protein EGK75_12520, partial [Neisseria weixii]
SIRITPDIFEQCLGAGFAGFPLLWRGLGSRRASPKRDGGDGGAGLLRLCEPSLTEFFEYGLFEVF